MGTSKHIETGRHSLVFDTADSRFGYDPADAGKMGDLFTGFYVTFVTFADPKLVNRVVCERSRVLVALM